MTRAVYVIVERSPGGGMGWSMQVGAVHHFAMPCTEFRALDWTREQLVAQGAERSERGRVIRLLIRELDRKARAETVAEVAHV
jgi:predicted secreted protein